ncbi:MAG: hypothetical protein OXD44_11420 [Gammaproteobacteria bacterium]|nr:hypothetical protein [Gammaproteobacteria bacterium]
MNASYRRSLAGASSFGFGKLGGIIIWMMVSEGIFGMPEQILPIKKPDGLLGRWS